MVHIFSTHISREMWMILHFKRVLSSKGVVQYLIFVNPQHEQMCMEFSNQQSLSFSHKCNVSMSRE